MEPKIAGKICVGLFVLNLVGFFFGIFVEFLALEPALWGAAIYSLACTSIYPLHVRHQRRNMHRYSDDMRAKVIQSFGENPRKTHAVLVVVTAVFAFCAFLSTGSALFSLLFGAAEERPFTVDESKWIDGNGRRGGGRCYDTKLAEFPRLGQVPHNLCFDAHAPEGTRLLIGGYHSSLGTWVFTVRGA